MVHDKDTSRRTFLKGAGAAAAAASLAGCSGGGDQETTDAETTADDDGADTETVADEETETTEEEGDGGAGEFEVTITQGQMPTGLDPHDHRETSTDNVVLHAYEGLLARDREGATIEGLATEYERVEDGLVRFTIRDGVTFHNGDDFTPQDAAYSINRIVDPEVDFESPQNDQLAGVTGAEVSSDADSAIDVSSDGFNPTVFSSFATYGDMVQQSWIEDNESAYINQNMNGTGPFQFAEYSQDEQVVLERYDDYWDGAADVSELTFTAASESGTRVNQLLSGETDVIVNVPPQDAERVRGNDGTRLSAVPSTRLVFAAMRYDVEPFSSQQFRQAMNYAVDLDSIIENVLQTFGAPTAQPTLEGFVGHNPDLDPYPYDPDQAESLVEESGFAGAEITLDGPTGRYLRDVEIAQAVADQIDSLSNVSCSYNQREFSSLAGEVTNGDITTSPPFYLLGWGEATFEGALTIGSLMTTDGSLTSFSNEEIDDLHAQAQSEPDAEERESILQELNAVVHEQAPWVFLNRQYSVYGVNDRVSWEARSDERINAYAMSPSE
ncbi:ABC transporter substrate-binding protein [Halorussus halobius]|uniref:ABC transporter substrate-binding protein n=1 Tax=Halorussus halobius TaxID=1710537 RepID=UPI0010926EAF|nr:ABC transporter substrate-binding protein [Halorussus halobius]